MDNDLIRQRSEFLVLETLTVSVIRYLAQEDASFSQALEHLRTQGLEKLQTQSVSRVDAVISDHLTAELSEAWERLMQQVLTPKP